MKRIIAGLAGLVIAGVSLTACSSSGGSSGNAAACASLAKWGVDAGAGTSYSNMATASADMESLQKEIPGIADGSLSSAVSTLVAESSVSGMEQAVVDGNTECSNLGFDYIANGQLVTGTGNSSSSGSSGNQPLTPAQQSIAAKMVAAEQSQAAEAQQSQAAAQQSQAAAQQSEAAAAAAQQSAQAVQSAAAAASQNAAENATEIAAQNKAAFNSKVQQYWMGAATGKPENATVSITVPNGPSDTGKSVTMTCTATGSPGNQVVTCTGDGQSVQFDN
jgi:hypothetical protein